MSSPDRGHSETPGTRSEAPAKPAAADADAYANWLDRMQRARARHAAITKNLYTWSSYKNWAERVKDAWDAETAPASNKK